MPADLIDANLVDAGYFANECQSVLACRMSVVSPLIM